MRCLELRTVTTDFSVGPKGLSVKNSGRETPGIFLHDPNGGGHVADLEGVARNEQVGQPGQELPGVVLGRALPDDRDLGAPGLEPDLEGVLDGSQVFVGDPEQGGQSGFRQG